MIAETTVNTVIKCGTALVITCILAENSETIIDKVGTKIQVTVENCTEKICRTYERIEREKIARKAMK